MQIDGNHGLKQRILAGELDQNRGKELERACLRALGAYDQGECSINKPLEALSAYDDYLGETERQREFRSREYRVTLEDRPWDSCRCGICEQVGIQVVIFRGTERNKRRGFHNLFVFNQSLQRELALAS
jgi:hypothetical protein